MAAGEGGPLDVLVTGAGSFVGNYIVRDLTELGLRVGAVYRTSTPAVESLRGFDNLTLIRGDLTDSAFVESLPRCAAGVIHVAASGAGPTVSGVQLIRDNALATAGLVDYAVSAESARFIFLSSISVHGEVRDPVISAGTEVRIPEMYGLTKRAAELLLEERSSELASLAVRLPAVLGRSARSHWLSRVVATALSGRDIEISNPSALFNNAVHQADLCRFMRTLLESEFSGFQAFPLASSDPIPIKDVVSTVLTETASNSGVVVIESGSAAFAIDSSYARTKLGYESLSVEAAVRRYAREEAADE